jgi:hypothetical protein
MLAFHMICLYVLRILSCPSMNHSTVPLWLSFQGTKDMLPNSLSLLEELSNCIPYISFSFLLQPSKFKLFVSCRFPFFQIYSVIDFFSMVSRSPFFFFFSFSPIALMAPSMLVPTEFFSSPSHSKHRRRRDFHIFPRSYIYLELCWHVLS